MQKAFIFKILSMAGIVCLLLIALGMIKSKIDEREQRRNSIVEEMSDLHGGQQQISGPLLVLPCVKTVNLTPANLPSGMVPAVQKVDCSQRITPVDLNVEGSIATNTLKRGIYHAQVTRYSLTLTGRFDVPEDATEITDKPFISIPLEKASALTTIPELQWNGQAVKFLSSAGPGLTLQGVHAFLPMNAGDKGKFVIKMDISAGETFAFSPVGDTTKISLKSKWPHPSFSGNFLPTHRSVNDAGFTAEWNINRFASNIPALLKNCENLLCSENPMPVVRIRLVNPVDIYLTSYRAAEYGWIVITIAFGLFFLMEILNNLRIHPAQYLLVGLSQAMFFLLLFSASEHLEFELAYLVAAIVCLLVNGIYVKAILSDTKSFLLFNGMSICLFGFIYLVLNAEDFSLLGGSVLSVSLLSTAMLLTRNVDWYQINEKMGAALQKK